ncbi:MAG: TetR/AcrR family transcriptional regulator [Kineosporiaceae bacterium]
MVTDIATGATKTEGRSAGPGRPRDAGVDVRVLDAARAVLGRRGYDGFSVDEVASTAGVAKSTLYRRWPTRDHLVVASLTSVLQREAPLADTGTIRGDLLSTLSGIADFLRHPAYSRLVAEMVAMVARHEDLAEQIHAAAASRRRAGVALVERAVARGELRADVDANVLTDQLVGPLYYRILVSGEPVDDAFLDRLVDTSLRGVAQSQGSCAAPRD